jgi:hypothetical protein
MPRYRAARPLQLRLRASRAGVRLAGVFEAVSGGEVAGDSLPTPKGWAVMRVSVPRAAIRTRPGEDGATWAVLRALRVQTPTACRSITLDLV